MGALGDSTKVGNEATFVASSRKDTDKNNPRRTSKDSPRSPDAIPGSAFTNKLYAKFRLRKSKNTDNDNDHPVNDDDVTALPLESYGFPYYRSYRNGKHCQDAVLVKDIGVSCTLLDENFFSHDSSKDSSVESYLVKCLKTEYNDLSEITKKISDYTSEIIRNLILRDRKREEIRSKPVTRRDNDKGKPYLNMELQNEVQCLYRGNIVDSSGVSIDNRKVFTKDDIEMTRTKIKGAFKDQVNLREVSNRGTSYSSTDSSSIVYDYLMMGNRGMCGRTQRDIAKLVDNETNRRFHRKVEKIKNNKENIESPAQITLTNWQEISRATLRKNKGTSKISRHTMISHKNFTDQI